MNFKKQVTLTFLSAIITIVMVFGGYSIYAATTDYEQYYTFKALDPGSSMTTLKFEYHNNVNDYFNHKFEALATLIDSNADFQKDEKFKAPDTDKTKAAEKMTDYVEKCKDNVSSFCVAIGATDIYTTYLDVLNNFGNTIPTVVTNVSAENLFSQIQSRTAEVDKESKDAKVAMEAAINTYDEFKTAYPMHKKYSDIITNLVKYKIALGKIRVQTDLFPTKFVDATSDQCE